MRKEVEQAGDGPSARRLTVEPRLEVKASASTRVICRRDRLQQRQGSRSDCSLRGTHTVLIGPFQWQRCRAVQIVIYVGEHWSIMLIVAAEAGEHALLKDTPTLCRDLSANGGKAQETKYHDGGAMGLQSHGPGRSERGPSSGSPP